MNPLWIAALALFSAPALADPVGDRDLQWIFRDKQGDGTASPAAIFLSWNYSGVIMKAECSADEFGNSGKAGNGGMTLFYYPDPVVVRPDEYGQYADAPFSPYVLTRGKQSLQFPAKVSRSGISGSIAITPQLLAILKPATNELEIEATNEMDEPWYVGQAEPLYRLALTCAAK